MHFYFRQLSDAKIKPVIEIMKPINLKNYAGLCGRVLARAHARTCDPVVLTGYWARARPSKMPWPISAWLMPGRMNGTTWRWYRPCAMAGLRRQIE